jgi:isoquinoline 1-oxidoreductase beta subunit
MKVIENVSRRGFLKAVGIASGSFVLGIKLPFANAKTSLKSTFHQLNFFVGIANDSTITLVCHRSEMGQGIRTSVPQIIAEELEANWQQVNVVSNTMCLSCVCEFGMSPTFIIFEHYGGLP